MTPPLAGPQSLLRALNARAVLEVLAEHGPSSRTELMERTGLSRTAVTQLVRALRASGELVPAGHDRDTRGPAAERVALNPGLGLALAAHCARDRVAVALVDASGTVRQRAHAELAGPEETARALARLLAGLREAAGPEIPLLAGIVGVPGIVARDGTVRTESGPDDGALRDALARLVSAPLRLENDVNLAALTELARGAEPDASFALLSLDPGLGAAIVIGGALHRGAGGGAGEVAYLPQPGVPLGAPVLGGEQLAAVFAAHGIDPGTAPLAVLDAAGRGEPASRAAVEELAGRLALVAASLRLVLDPEAIVLADLAAHPAFLAAVDRAATAFADRLPIPIRAASPAPTGADDAEATTAVALDDPTLAGAAIEAAAELRSRLFPHVPAAAPATTAGPRAARRTDPHPKGSQQ
ncbi:ROK family transcriptional regulator [Agromyces mediolanus]|uniref:ROK family transcriptional regulator n=1 Tax=Agromyces mediolanus TaxID=41986 RepID=UPI0038386BA1